MEAKINLVVAVKGGRSFVRSLYTTPPFRLLPVGQLCRDGACHLMQMTTSPGVLSGDSYEIDIEVESGARLQLESQSYQRLYDMETQAQQCMSIKLGDDAHFSQVPHPIVPHRNSAYSSHTRVEMGQGSSFLQSEIITCGRKFHGERFAFREFSNSVEVYCEGQLRLRDRVWLKPRVTPLGECGLLEGYSHQGTLIYQSCAQEDIRSIIERVYEQLSRVESLRFGVSATHYTGFVVRALGDGGEVLYEAFKAIQNVICRELDITK